MAAGPHVLVIDDEPSLVAALELALGRAGYAVRGASEPEAVRALLDEAPPALVLIDSVMPVTDGYAWLAALRARPAWAGTKLVMLSGRSREADRRRALDTGADLFLAKPFTAGEVVDAVGRLLGGN